MSEELVDVIEVQIKAPHTIRVLDIEKTKENAEAIIKMAVIRRGVEDQFYTTCPAHLYKDGDKLKVKK